MGEEVRMTEFDVNDDGDCNGDDERIVDWEMGLPNGEDLTPLSQSLIPPELASAFSISPLPYRTLHDVNRASQSTLSSIRGSHEHALSSINNSNGNNDENLESFTENCDPMIIESDEPDANGSGTDLRLKPRKPDCIEEADSALRTENSIEDPSARTSKRPRLVWTPQLHKRFVDVVAHLGIKNAVPKTIMQLMNVEGLTRENVASHLQKYRLYLKRMQGLSNDDPSSSDHQLFASTPVPPQCLHYESANGAAHVGHISNSNNNNKGNSHDNNNGNSNNGNGNNGHVGMAVYGAPQGMMSVPMYGMMNHQGFHQAHGFDPSMYNMNMNMGMGMNMNMRNNNVMHHQGDWSVGKHAHGLNSSEK